MAYGKDIEGSRPPHWMRSMEEKYQRLHAKIADQALKFSQSRNSVAVRLRELRQRNYSTPMSTDVDVYSKNHRKTSEHSKLKPVSQNTGGKQCPTLDYSPESKGIDYINKKRPRTHVSVTSRLTNPNTVHEYGNDTTGVIDDAAARRSSSALASVRVIPPAAEDHGSNQSSSSSERPDKSQVDDVIERVDTDLPIGTDTVTDLPSNSTNAMNINDNDKSLESINNNGPDEQKVEEFHDSNNNSEQNINQSALLSNMKISKATIAKNRCEDSNSKKRPNKRAPSSTLTSKKKHQSKLTSNDHARKTKESRMRVFARMSMEAQHAIDETLKEMTWEHENQNDGDYTDKLRRRSNEVVSSKILRMNECLESGEKGFPETTVSREDSGRKTTMSTTSSNQTKPDSGENGSVAIEKPHAHHKDNYHPSKVSEPVICDNDPAGLSFLKHHGHQNKGTQLERTSTPHHEHFLPYPAPLPAIRHLGDDWSLAEDVPFEITSPDFDARFCETSIFHRDNCDTPSTDYIRQQAIEKCRLWLEHQLGKL